jgi:hypothetical protein
MRARNRASTGGDLSGDCLALPDFLDATLLSPISAPRSRGASSTMLRAGANRMAGCASPATRLEGRNIHGVIPVPEAVVPADLAYAAVIANPLAVS